MCLRNVLAVRCVPAADSNLREFVEDDPLLEQPAAAKDMLATHATLCAQQLVCARCMHGVVGWRFSPSALRDCAYLR